MKFLGGELRTENKCLFALIFRFALLSPSSSLFLCADVLNVKYKNHSITEFKANCQLGVRAIRFFPALESLRTQCTLMQESRLSKLLCFVKSKLTQFLTDFASHLNEENHFHKQSRFNSLMRWSLQIQKCLRIMYWCYRAIQLQNV